MLVVLEFYNSNVIKVYEMSDLSVDNVMLELANDPYSPEFLCPELIGKTEVLQDTWFDILDYNDLDEDCFDEDDNLKEDADLSKYEAIAEFKILTNSSVTIEGEFY